MNRLVNPIEADGEFYIPGLIAGNSYLLEIGGTFDGATVVPGTVDSAGVFVPGRESQATALSCTSSAAWQVVCPGNGKLAVAVTDADTDTAITVEVCGIRK